MFRPVGEPGPFVNRPIFANHAKLDVTFLQYVLQVCNIFVQLGTGERFANRQIFGEVHKIILISTTYLHTHNQLEYKGRDQVPNQLSPPPAHLEAHTLFFFFFFHHLLRATYIPTSLMAALSEKVSALRVSRGGLCPGFNPRWRQGRVRWREGQGGGHGLLPLSLPFGAGRQTGKNGAAMI